MSTVLNCEVHLEVAVGIPDITLQQIGQTLIQCCYAESCRMDCTLQTDGPDSAVAQVRVDCPNVKCGMNATDFVERIQELPALTAAIRRPV